MIHKIRNIGNLQRDKKQFYKIVTTVERYRVKQNSDGIFQKYLDRAIRIEKKGD